MLQKNASWTAQIEELNSFGHGVTHADGMVVFVTGAVPGDVVRARVIKVARTYAVARAEEILTPSPVREKDACPARGCGGCIYGSVTYEAERGAKRAGVAAAFRRAGLPEVTVEEVVSPSPRLGYRNKAQYPVALTPAGEPVIGFFAPHTHRVVEAAACPLQHPTFSHILEIVRGFVKKHHIPIYDEATGQGLLRHICLRVGEATGEILCVLVLTRGELPHADELTADLRAAVPGLVGVVLNINPAATNVVFGERFVTLWGRDRLTDILCGLRLRVAAPAFYQVNRRAAEALYALAAERAALSPSDVLLDLFCGAGSIGLSMAGRVREVIGVEIVPEAVECARANAAENGITNASFYCADAADAASLLASAEAERGAPIRPDVVVLDPPRKGCAAPLLDFLCRLAPPRVVYISCNPETLARDAARLIADGYVCGPVTPVDLFPRTAHVECVVSLTRRGSNDVG